jgi:hypothetical protein
VYLFSTFSLTPSFSLSLCLSVSLSFSLSFSFSSRFLVFQYLTQTEEENPSDSSTSNDRMMRKASHHTFILLTSQIVHSLFLFLSFSFSFSLFLSFFLSFSLSLSLSLSLYFSLSLTFKRSSIQSNIIKRKFVILNVVSCVQVCQIVLIAVATAWETYLVSSLHPSHITSSIIEFSLYFF